MSAQASVLFYAQIQRVYDRFKNTSSGLAVTASSLAIAWSKAISFEAIALDKASRQVTAVCRTPYPVSWQWFNKMWADLDNPDAFAPAVAQISIAVINFLPTRKHLKACFILKVEHIAIADAPIGPSILFKISGIFRIIGAGSKRALAPVHAWVLKPNGFVLTKGPLGTKTVFDGVLVLRKGQFGLTVFASKVFTKRKLMVTDVGV